MEIKRYLASVAEGAALSVVSSVVEPIINKHLPIMAANHAQLIDQLRHQPEPFLFRAVVKGPVMEELKYRYVPQLFLGKMGLNNKAVMIAGAVLFAYNHNHVVRDGKVRIDGRTTPIIHGFMGSYLWQVMESRDLLSAIALHASYNATTCFVTLAQDYLRTRRTKKILRELDKGLHYDPASN